MEALYQRTIAKKVSVTGIGLHSGKKVSLTLSPAPADSGVWFKRIDLGSLAFRATPESVTTTENNTTIGKGDNSIHTVEHLLAVLYGFGINNIVCEVDGPEIPIMDGSGASFIFLLKETGIAHLNSSKKFMVILHPVEVSAEDKWARIEPSSKLEIDSTIVFAHPQIKLQRMSFEFSCENFVREIGRARTFGLLKDVDSLKRKGLIRGGSLDNAVVLDDYKVLNPEGLRFDNEFVRHKILDIMGDISLMGHEVAGRVTTWKSGHNLHNLLCRKILATPSSYRIVSALSLESETLKAYELPGTVSVLHEAVV
jgi:UDP-3-O-[3-hydroxymyristoyl] N-acetylglucosamine deacetylase